MKRTICLLLSLIALFPPVLARPAVFEVVVTAVHASDAPQTIPEAKNDPFSGYPILERIAACESTGNPVGIPRQFLPDGTPLWGNDPKTGKPIKRDVGVLQINTWAHKDELAKLGLDVVDSEADNIKYGIMLYERSGTQPWIASEDCWETK
jgi:hypothetical protein